MNWTYYKTKQIGGGNALFALKAGILTSELVRSLPWPGEFRHRLDYSHSSAAVIPQVIRIFRIQCVCYTVLLRTGSTRLQENKFVWAV